MRRALSFLFLGALLWPASPAAAAPGYDVTIEAPSGVVKGSITVRARATGATAAVEHGAFHVRSPGGGWSQGGSSTMAKSGDVFTGGWSSDAVTNGVWEIEVRVWGSVPPYAPGDPATFATRTTEVKVDNAPPSPSGVTAVADGSAVDVSWSSVDTAGRSDFRGYRVYQATAQGCPGGLGGYRQVGATDRTSLRLTSLGKGSYCFRVASLRSSPASGTVASAPSAAASATVSTGSASGKPSVPGGGSGGSPDGPGGSSPAPLPAAPPAGTGAAPIETPSVLSDAIGSTDDPEGAPASAGSSAGLGEDELALAPEGGVAAAASSGVADDLQVPLISGAIALLFAAALHVVELARRF